MRANEREVRNARNQVRILRWLKNQLEKNDIYIPTVGDQTNNGWITEITGLPNPWDGPEVRPLLNAFLGDEANTDEYVKKIYMTNPLRTVGYLVEYATNRGAWYGLGELVVTKKTGRGLRPMILAFIDKALLRYKEEYGPLLAFR